MTTRPGTAMQAITFALDHIHDPIPNPALTFLLEWRGDIPVGVKDWERYLAWLETPEAKKIAEGSDV